MDDIAVPTQLQEAEAAFADGRLGEAEEKCRAILEAEPSVARAWYLLGSLAKRAGNLDFAEELTTQAIALDEYEALYWRQLGEIWYARYDLEKAEEYWNKAAELEPDLAEVKVSMATLLREKGRDTEAAAGFEKVIREHPENFEAHVRYGLILSDRSRFEEAIRVLRKATSLNPHSVEPWYHLARTLDQREVYVSEKAHIEGDFAEALSLYEKTCEMAPKLAPAWQHRADLLRRLDRADEALACAQKATELQPEGAGVHAVLAKCLEKMGKAAEARKAYALAASLGRRDFQFHLDHASASLSDGDVAGAREAVRLGLEQCPEDENALNRLGQLCLAAGLPAEALKCFLAASKLVPESAKLLHGTGRALLAAGKASEARQILRKALLLDQKDASIWQSLISSSLYSGDVAASIIAEEHRSFGVRLENTASLAGQEPRDSQDGSPRLGLLLRGSGHPSTESWMAALAEGLPGWEVFAYGEAAAQKLFERGQPSDVTWQSLEGLADADAAKRISEDRLDVLMDFAGLSTVNRVMVLAHQPVAVQVSLPGYPATLGMSRVGYRFVDEQPGENSGWARLFMERPLSLGRTVWNFLPQAAGTRSPLPALQNGYPTFGFVGETAQLNPRICDIWSSILHQVADARLILRTPEFEDVEVVEEWAKAITDAGIARERLLFETITRPSAGSLSDCWSGVDIGLDTSPYQGTWATFGALAAGVPIVVLRKQEALASQAGPEILKAANRVEWIADSEKGFVELAASLALDSELKDKRAKLFEEIPRSQLVDVAGFREALAFALGKVIADASI